MLRRPDVLIPALLLGLFLVLLVLVLARPNALTHADAWLRDRTQSVSHSEHYGDDERPNPNAETKRLSRSVPTLNPIRIAPMLLDLTITSVNVSHP